MDWRRWDHLIQQSFTPMGKRYTDLGPIFRIDKPKRRRERRKGEFIDNKKIYLIILILRQVNLMTHLGGIVIEVNNFTFLEC